MPFGRKSQCHSVCDKEIQKFKFLHVIQSHLAVFTLPLINITIRKSEVTSRFETSLPRQKTRTSTLNHLDSCLQLATDATIYHSPSSSTTPLSLIQVAIDTPPMQPCTVCLGASCGNGLRKLAALNKH